MRKLSYEGQASLFRRRNVEQEQDALPVYRNGRNWHLELCVPKRLSTAQRWSKIRKSAAEWKNMRSDSERSWEDMQKTDHAVQSKDSKLFKECYTKPLKCLSRRVRLTWIEFWENHFSFLEERKWRRNNSGSQEEQIRNWCCYLSDLD